jgi:hypothetical protein
MRKTEERQRREAWNERERDIKEEERETKGNLQGGRENEKWREMNVGWLRDMETWREIERWNRDERREERVCVRKSGVGERGG